MRVLTIYKLLFTKSDCFKSGTKQTSRGVQVHSTGANNPNLCRYVGPDDGRLGKNKYDNHSNRPGSDVCASAYIGKLKDGTVAVYQTLPWDYRCWLSGSSSNGNANRMGYVGFEICEDDLNDESYFREAVMTASVNLTAYLCSLFGVTPRTVIQSFSQGDALAVMDHQELRSRKLASNHADILHWLKRYGLNMEDYRDAVEAAMQDGVEVKYIDCTADHDVPVETPDEENTPMKYQAKVTNPGAYLNLRAEKSVESDSLARLYRGVVVDVLDDSDDLWWRVRYNGAAGFAMTHDGDDRYLTPISEDQAKDDEATPTPKNTVTVDRAQLEAIYAEIGKLLDK